ncbi:MAG: FitA-like ribbon-helix-helix domain-containing protein [Myxococcota bacterium]
MPTVTIRNVPEDVLQRLKTLARRNNRSMEEELRHLIASKTAERLSVLTQIEESWEAQSRPTTPDEVDAWIRGSRP